VGRKEEELTHSAAPVEISIQPLTRLSQNLPMVPSFDTLVLRRVLRHNVRHEQSHSERCSGESQKPSFVRVRESVMALLLSRGDQHGFDRPIGI